MKPPKAPPPPAPQKKNEKLSEAVLRSSGNKILLFIAGLFQLTVCN